MATVKNKETGSWTRRAAEPLGDGLPRAVRKREKRKQSTIPEDATVSAKLRKELHWPPKEIVWWL